MGIPTYTRWLCRKYPLILKQLSTAEERENAENGASGDEQKATKQPYVFDNFYIDMNGILHDCAHGQILSTIPRNCDDVFENLQKYGL